MAISAETPGSEPEVDEEGSESEQDMMLRPEDDSGLKAYARDHIVHLVVIAFFGAYPGIHYVLVNSPIGKELALFLPRVDTMVVVFYFGLFAMSFDFISGYTGYLSFGHAMFAGAGAYLVLMIANGKIPGVASDTPFMVSLIIVGIVSVLLAVLVGVVSFRLTGVYFAMITLGFAQVFYVFMSNWNYLSSNPRDGMSVLGHPEAFEIGIPYTDISLGIASADFVGQTFENLFGLGINLSATEVSYYAIGVIVVICYFAMQRIIHSPFGRVMITIRENEERAKAIGYNTFKYKITAFAVSGFFGGIGGALFAGYRRSVAPDNSFYFLVTGKALIVSIIGGFGTLAGPLFGTLFDDSFQEFLSKQAGGPHIDLDQLGLITYLRDTIGEGLLDAEIIAGFTAENILGNFINGHEQLYIGILFVVFVLYVPHGILGTLRTRVGGKLSKMVPMKLARYFESGKAPEKDNE